MAKKTRIIRVDEDFYTYLKTRKNINMSILNLTKIIAKDLKENENKKK